MLRDIKLARLQGHWYLLDGRKTTACFRREVAVLTRVKTHAGSELQEGVDLLRLHTENSLESISHKPRNVAKTTVNNNADSQST